MIEGAITARVTAAILARLGGLGAALYSYVRSDGWTISIVLSGYPLATTTFDPTKVVVSTTADGFDATGAATTVARTLNATVVLRKPYPDEAGDQVSSGLQVVFALDDFIYSPETSITVDLASGWATDAVLGDAPAQSSVPVTNSSSLSYPLPIAHWSIPPFQRDGATAHLELVAAHGYARSGSQVAAVKFELTGETSAVTVSSVVTAMTKSTWRADANPVQVYEADLSTATLTQGEVANARAIVYPFIGDTPLDSSDVAFPAASEFTNQPHLIDKTGGYGTAYAYVDPVAGDDGTGVTSATAATALASPYLTVYAAMLGIKAFNNTTYSHDDTGGGIIRLLEGSHLSFGGDCRTITPGDTWVTIEAAPGTVKANVLWEANATASKKYSHKKCLFKAITVAPTATGAPHIVVDGTDATTPTAHVWLDDVDVVGHSDSVPPFYRCGFFYMTIGTVTTAGSVMFAQYSTTPQNVMLVRGVTGDDSGSPKVNLMLGCTFTTGSYLAEIGTTSYAASQDGYIIAYNKLFGLSAGAINIGKQKELTKGCALLGNVFEAVTTTTPLISLSADSNIIPISNPILFGNTVMGARMNFMYNDTGTVAILKHLMFCKHNIFMDIDHKDDTFGTGNGNRIGSWSAGHKVAWRGNVITQDAGEGHAPTRTGWFGEVLEADTVVLGAPNFTADKSSSSGGDGLGSGDYTITAPSDAIGCVASGTSVLPYDLSGAARRNDGTGSAGAYES